MKVDVKVIGNHLLTMPIYDPPRPLRSKKARLRKKWLKKYTVQVPDREKVYFFFNPITGEPTVVCHPAIQLDVELNIAGAETGRL